MGRVLVPGEKGQGVTGHVAATRKGYLCPDTARDGLRMFRRSIRHNQSAGPALRETHEREPRGVRRYLGGGWSDRTLPVNVFLVHHPAGLCLFDTGQTARAAEPGYHPRWHPFLRLARFELAPEDEIGAQLVRSGVDPAAVRWVVGCAPR